MTANYLWPERPPDEKAHSRVTNPQRFAPLHDIAAKLLNRLEATFYVERTERYGLDPEVEAVELARPSAGLIPRNPGAAPIVVAFTRFPGFWCVAAAGPSSRFQVVDAMHVVRRWTLRLNASTA
jgi:Family of unknown function (DUF6226)